jgi:hypothetical protein
LGNGAINLNSSRYPFQIIRDECSRDLVFARNHYQPGFEAPLPGLHVARILIHLLFRGNEYNSSGRVDVLNGDTAIGARDSGLISAEQPAGIISDSKAAHYGALGAIVID